MRKQKQPITDRFWSCSKQSHAARVLSSLKILGLRPRILKLDKTLLFVF